MLTVIVMGYGDFDGNYVWLLSVYTARTGRAAITESHRGVLGDRQLLIGDDPFRGCRNYWSNRAKGDSRVSTGCNCAPHHFVTCWWYYGWLCSSDTLLIEYSESCNCSEKYAWKASSTRHDTSLSFAPHRGEDLPAATHSKGISSNSPSFVPLCCHHHHSLLCCLLDELSLASTVGTFDRVSSPLVGFANTNHPDTNAPNFHTMSLVPWSKHRGNGMKYNINIWGRNPLCLKSFRASHLISHTQQLIVQKGRREYYLNNEDKDLLVT